jgi:4-amino-4-deoxy-L-arabinose transferase-like glycosyltransferase
MKKIVSYLWLMPIAAFVILGCSGSRMTNSGLDDQDYFSGIAWTMYHSGNYLLPKLNGILYPDKPPILFWAMNAAWRLLGVNVFSIQLLTGGLIAIWIVLLRQTYKVVFPQDTLGSLLFPFLFVSLYQLWSEFYLLRVDLFLVIAVSLYNLIVLSASKNKCVNLLSLLGAIVATTLGVFSKGPIFFVFSLLPLILFTVFDRKSVFLYLKIMLSTLIGTLLFLGGWVLPACLNGGEEFTKQILYQQAATHAAKHKVYFLRYVAMLPDILFPWTLNILLFKKIGSGIRSFWKDGRYLCLVVIISLCVFSFIASKQPRYMMPIIPYLLFPLARYFSLYNSKKSVIVLNKTLLVAMFIFIAIASLSAYFYSFNITQKHSVLFFFISINALPLYCAIIVSAITIAAAIIILFSKLKTMLITACILYPLLTIGYTAYNEHIHYV